MDISLKKKKKHPDRLEGCHFELKTWINVDIGEGGRVVPVGAAGFAQQGAIGQVEDVGRAHVLGVGDDLGHQLSQPGAAKAADEHDRKQAGPDAENQRQALLETEFAGAAQQQNVVGTGGEGGGAGVGRQLQENGSWQ